MDRIELIAQYPRTAKVLKNGQDISASLGVEAIKYNADGTAWRKFQDGTVESGTWRFLNPEQTQIEVEMPKGTTRWVILELHDDVYRKANIENGVEFIYSPLR